VATFQAARFTMAPCLAFVAISYRGGAHGGPKGPHKAGCQSIRPVSKSLKSAPRWDANASGLSRRVARRHHTGTPAHPDWLNEPQNGTALGRQRIRPVSTNLKTTPSWEPQHIRPVSTSLKSAPNLDANTNAISAASDSNVASTLT
jgi:hypothetical protein